MRLAAFARAALSTTRQVHTMVVLSLAPARQTYHPSEQQLRYAANLSEASVRK